MENRIELEAAEVEGDCYAEVAVTEYYGPRSDARLVGVTESAAEAAAWAKDYDPDWDDVMGCHRLSSGQSSPTRGEVRQATRLAGDPWGGKWCVLPNEVLEALPDSLSARLDLDGALRGALAVLGWEILRLDAPGEAPDAYLVRLAD